jgi:hypothetical protein
MRFILKPVAKQVRFDRVYLTSSSLFLPRDIALIGTEACPEDSDVFPSDHYGLYATFVVQ